MRMFSAIALTALITAFATNFFATTSRDDRYADLLLAKCPQLVMRPKGSDAWYIQMLDGGVVPVRPR